MNDAAAQQVAVRDSLISVRKLSKSYRLGSETIPVLSDVSFDVAAGEFLAIRGSSGVGKSTLLNLLGLLDRPSSGELYFDGKNLSLLSEAERTRIRAVDLAFVFQFYFLLPEFSALENVLMPALIAHGRGRAPRSDRERNERGKMLLDRVGLGHRLRHRPYQLSGGEKQRVAIARALMNQPRLVLCDEPTGNLDSKTAHGIHELLHEINQSFGQTILVVTHEDSMARVARRRLLIQDGALNEQALESDAS